MALRIPGKNFTTKNFIMMNHAAKDTGKKKQHQKTTMTSLTIGKEVHNIPIMKMADASDPQYLKARGFDQLSDALRGKVGEHPVSDLIHALSSQVPMETSSAFAEADKVRQRIIASATDPANLMGVAFLNYKGNHFSNKIAKAKKKRPAGITYLRVNCHLVGQDYDSRITVQPLDTQFCLKLTQSAFYQKEGLFIPLTALTKKRKLQASKKGRLGGLLGDSDDEDDEDSLSNIHSVKKQLRYSTPKGSKGKAVVAGAEDEDDEDEEDEEDEYDLGSVAGQAEDGVDVTVLGQKTPTSVATLKVSATPKADILMESDGGNVIISWYGDTDLLDNAAAFVKEFKTLTPPIHSAEPCRTETKQFSPRATIENFAAECMFDVFIGVLRLDYVGTADAVDLTMVCTEICKRIQSLKQSARNANGHWIITSPDELFRQYMELIPDLPEDTSRWTMQLSHAYFAALDEDIRDSLADRHYVLPMTVSGATKSDAIAALRSVRSAAVREHRQTNRMRQKFSTYYEQMLAQGNRKGGTQRGSVQLTHGENEKPESTVRITQDESTIQMKQEKAIHLPPATPDQPVPRKPNINMITPEQQRNLTGTTLWSSKSPAETTLEKYGSKLPNTIDGTLKVVYDEKTGCDFIEHRGARIRNRYRIPITVGPSGALYPFDPVTKVVSKYPLNFRGCFKCGKFHDEKESGNRRSRCLTYLDKEPPAEVMAAFWHELHMHLPHTRRNLHRQPEDVSHR